VGKRGRHDQKGASPPERCGFGLREVLEVWKFKNSGEQQTGFLDKVAIGKRVGKRGFA